MNFKEYTLLREHFMLNEMPHVELFKTGDDYFIVDFRSEDGKQWIDHVINIFKKHETLDLEGKKTVKIPANKIAEIENSLANNMFFLNILKSDIKSLGEKGIEKAKLLPPKIKIKLGI